MASLDILLAFVVTTSVFALIPGPAMLYAAARTMAGGRLAGVMAVAGIHLGAYVHILASVAGLSVLFHAVPLAYTLVKLVGALYLVWLGISMWRARTGETGHGHEAPVASPRRAFAQSVAVEVLNPKTALFFLAFLPQFVDSAASLPVWLQFLILGIAVNAIFTLADLVCVALAGLIVSRVRQSGRAQRLAQRLGGTILIGLGGHLALQRS
ncbi:LysE family translocator [Rhizobium sp. RU36D]|uniref:LysE family translocator n=1 Tax=Rhizobium sp. RU36D TaxID=1907415 RepID=UPI0009D7E586|nr:LysE family translocator [Rhizobium sp. RU36D]SMC98593.1 Threonine/homoserine/homoserine lactone efflux protein [Rhizobium sp. RU36D]